MTKTLRGTSAPNSPHLPPPTPGGPDTQLLLLSSHPLGWVGDHHIPGRSCFPSPKCWNTNQLSSAFLLPSFQLLSSYLRSPLLSNLFLAPAPLSDCMSVCASVSVTHVLLMGHGPCALEEPLTRSSPGVHLPGRQRL